MVRFLRVICVFQGTFTVVLVRLPLQRCVYFCILRQIFRCEPIIQGAAKPPFLPVEAAKPPFLPVGVRPTGLGRWLMRRPPTPRAGVGHRRQAGQRCGNAVRWQRRGGVRPTGLIQRMHRPPTPRAAKPAHSLACQVVCAR